MRVPFILIFLAISLGGCNLAHTLSTGGAAGGGALLCTTITANPLAGAGCASAAVASVEILAPIEPEKPALKEITNEHQAEVAKKQLMYDLIADAWHWLLIVGGILLLLFWFLPSPKEWFKKKE